MKTRIISGIIMGVIVAAVLGLGFWLHTAIITVAVALLAAVAVYELIHNAAGIEDKPSVIGAIVGALLIVLSDALGAAWSVGLFTAIILYGIYAAIMVLKNHKDFDLAKKKFAIRCKDIQYVPGVGIDNNKFDFSFTFSFSETVCLLFISYIFFIYFNNNL